MNAERARKKLDHLMRMYDENRLNAYIEKTDSITLISILEEVAVYSIFDLETKELQIKAGEIVSLIQQAAKEKSLGKKDFIPTDFVKWQTTINVNFPEFFRAAKACASVIAQLKINDIKNPCALCLIDVPSSGKTITLNFFSQLDEIVYFSDNFSPASFVSHSANVKKEKLKEIDLLPRIVGKTLIVPELAPLFGARDDDLLKNFGILTRVLDGEGLQTDTGVHGQRGYKGDYSFMLLAGSTPIAPRVWKVMGTLGSRLFFFSIRSKEKDIEQLAKQLKNTAWKEKLKSCQESTANFLRTVDNLYPEGINWERENDPDELLQIIARCAKLLARLRAPINIWKDRSTDSQNEYSHTLPNIEQPDRINQILYNLARGHALISGRIQLTNADIEIVLNIAFDSCPFARAKLIRLILDNQGEVTTHVVMEGLNCSDETARKEMEAFKILGLVDLNENEPTVGRPQYKITLKKDFSWFFSDICRNLFIDSTTSKSLGKVQSENNFPSKSDTVLDENFKFTEFD